MENTARLGAVSRYVIKRLRELRLKQGLTAKELAKRAGIPAASYACLEGGRYRLNFDILFRVLLVLGQPVTAVWPIGDGNQPVAQVTDEVVDARIEQAESLLAHPPGIDDIIRTVCSVCNVDLEALQGTAKRRHISQARGIAAILTHEQPHLTLNRLAQVLRKNPASLTHLKKNAAKQISRNPRLQDRLTEARLLIKEQRTTGSHEGR